MSDQTAIEDFDLLVVGGGKAGKSLAMERAKKGLKVAMVERRFVGGTCINVACIPTKTLVASARRLENARTDEAFGVVGTSGASVDLGKLRAHKEGIVSAMVGAHEKMFAAPGLDFIRGEARFVAERTVEVALEDGGTRTIRGERVLVNLGSRPARPEIPGLWESGAWTNEEILRLETLPKSLAIIGASYIGVEFASMMAAFGVEVSLISSGAHVLPREDEDVAAEMEASLTDMGVSIVGNARALSALREDGLTTLLLSNGQTLSAEAVLVAAGRTPNTDGIGLENAGIALDERGFIAVDEHLRTSAENVWAAGDAAGTPMFTHASWSDFRIIRAQFDGADDSDPRTSKAGRVMPYAVFATPELGRIGLSETEAREAGREVLVAKIPVAQIPRAKTMRASRGVWKGVVDAATHEILGVAIQGPDSGEVVTAVQVAMAAGMTYENLCFLPIAHPTMGEGLQILLDQLA
ncbi:dihydrolipoyl dehydrogenase family protein [Actinomyces culturomici]|uniref:dihydrolipoyl dehydrogenase family protein n=1 Tax=Actinomyces culturomici TaxID=1926276 RepID=UPI000E20B192|nr:FAD-dependent oxidoreductase [Actinomyces culturomici]